MYHDFTENGFFIRYPADWTLEEDAESNGETILLQAPGECGFFSLSRYPASMSADELAKIALNAITEEYANCDISPARDSYGTYTLTGFDVEFFCMDLPCSVTIRAIRHSDATYVIFTQAIDALEESIKEMFVEITRMWVERLNSTPEQNPGT